jgi:mRNA-degrading endonuclease RelE of RelBE toxin-antitoxin system
MKVVETDNFKRSLRRVPPPVQHLYQSQRARFLVNRLDPRLHVKQLRGTNQAYSFRVTRRYRVIFYLSEQAAIFVDIAHRKGIYR